MELLIKTTNIQEFIAYILSKDEYSRSANDKHAFSKSNILFLNKFDKFLFAIGNLDFLRRISANEISRELIEENLNKLTNGVVILICKKTFDTVIYNDVFGFYPVFYIEIDGKILYISNAFNQLTCFCKHRIDNYAILDMLLFNYPLFNRTLNQNVKRLVGGSVICINQFNQSCKFGLFNYANNFTFSSDRKERLLPERLGLLLNDAINCNNKTNFHTCLTMTAGFDSRTLLASLNNLKIAHNTITFGQEGNIEMLLVRDFIKKYSRCHTNVLLDSEYVDNLLELVKEFSFLTADGPVVLDLPHYLYIKDIVNLQNLIVGFMGGEILVGQSIGSEVTFTRFAGEVLKAKSENELRILFDVYLRNIPFVDYEKVRKIDSDYLNSISYYLKDPTNNYNVLKFLINEKYAKFFGTINKLYLSGINLSIPFMNSDVLNYVLNSNNSFLKKARQFNQRPFGNLKIKKLHAKTILKLCPDLGETSLDRLYKVNDLAKFYRLPFVFWGYIESHFLKINKIKYVKPHHYDNWYKDIMITPFNKAVEYYDIFDRSYTMTKERYETLSSIEKKRIAITASIWMTNND